MKKMDNRGLIKIYLFLIVFGIVFVWVFAGWPQIWQEPRVPPEIQEASAQAFQMEWGTQSSVSDAAWTTINFTNTYTNPVFLCFPNYNNNIGNEGDSTADSMVCRVNNLGTTSTEVMLQEPGASTLASAETIHYLVVEEGTYTSPIKMEAFTYTSTVTDENNSWVGESQTYGQSYTNPVVLGQVMTYSDSSWSVFWSHDGSQNEPTASNLYTGKHVAEDTDITRANETVGVVVFEQGNGTLSSIPYEVQLQGESIDRIDDSPPQSYTFAQSFSSTPQVAIGAVSGMNGGNGSSPVLYGTTPLSTTQIDLSMVEDEIGDTEMSGILEHVPYIVFESAGSYGADEPFTEQLHFRWRDDTTDLNTDGGWLATEDNNTISDITKNTTYRLRVESANTGASTESAARTYELQWGEKTGQSSCGGIISWTGVGDDTEFDMVDTTNIDPDGESTSPALLANSEGYTYTTGEGRDVADTTGSTGPMASSTYTEIEYSFKATDDAVTGHTYCFRLYDTTAGSALDSYSAYPEATINSVKFSTVIGEVGQDSTDYNGKTVNLNNTYINPVVIVEPISGDNAGGSTNRPANTVITATTSNSFTVKIQEPDNETDDHGTETFSYLVVEEGAWELPDGTKIDADTLSTTAYYGNGVSGGSWDTCSFTQTFSSAPVVLSSLQTDNNTGTPDFLNASIDGVAIGNWTCAIEVPDNATSTPSSAETIGWVAIDSGTGTNNSIPYEAGTTGVNVEGWTETWHTQSFSQSFSSAPRVLAFKQTLNGSDGGWIRYDALGTSGVDLAIEERDDGERSHTGTEEVGYFAFESSGNIISSEIAFDQTTHRFYNNADSVQPGTAKAAENTAITNLATNDIIRIRTAIQVGLADLGISTQAFKLQYGQGSDCSAIGTWNDVDSTGGAGIWRGYNNTTPADGAQITSSLLNSQSNALESYEEQNNSVSNPASVTRGSWGEWDWVVQNNGATASTDYCFRMTIDDGSVIQYTNYPKVTTASGGNNPPDEPSNVTLNSGGTIVLNENITTSVQLTASTSDPDGASDITSATGTAYWSDVAGGGGCTADDNNCYRLSSSDCSFDVATSTVTCTADIWFHANSTDASSTYSGNWQGNVTVTDSAGATNSSSTATGVELQTLWAINITAGTPINYGFLNPDATSTNQIVTTNNTGNAALDLELSGTDMTNGSTIAVGQQKYATSTIGNWSTCTDCTALSGTETAFDVSLAKPTSSSTAVTDDTYWMLYVPTGTASGTYSGTNTFGAIGDQ